jgi:hypothetical protein
MDAKVPVAMVHAVLLFGLFTGRQTPAATVPSPQVATAARPEGATQMLYDAALQRMVLLTASNASPRQQLWAWSGRQWQLIDVPGPPVRELGAAASDVRRKRIVLHGGVGLASRDDRHGDTWEWDGTAWHAMADLTVGTRDHHAMAFDDGRGRTVLFGGGRSPETLETTTWEWDGVTWRQVATQGPGGRAHTAMVYDSLRKRIVMFGGLGEGYRALADTWAWNGTAWSRIADGGPPPRSHHHLAFDGRAGGVVLFGGLGLAKPAAALGDTWVLDGDRWRQVETVGPARRSGHVMAFDPVRQRTMLFGGGAFDGRVVTSYDDTWEWDGAQWTQLEAGQPRTRTVGR